MRLIFDFRTIARRCAIPNHVYDRPPIPPRSQVQDRGLLALAAGCPHIAFACFANCVLLTDAGAGALVRGCRRLRVVNFENCARLTDVTVCALGGCTGLNSVNIARCASAPESS